MSNSPDQQVRVCCRILATVLKVAILGLVAFADRRWRARVRKDAAVPLPTFLMHGLRLCCCPLSINRTRHCRHGLGASTYDGNMNAALGVPAPDPAGDAPDRTRAERATGFFAATEACTEEAFHDSAPMRYPTYSCARDSRIPELSSPGMGRGTWRWRRLRTRWMWW